MLDLASTVADITRESVWIVLILFSIIAPLYAKSTGKPPTASPTKAEGQSATQQAPKKSWSDRKKPSVVSQFFRFVTYSLMLLTTLVFSVGYLASHYVLAQNDQGDVKDAYSYLFRFMIASAILAFVIALMKRQIRVNRQVNRLVTNTLGVVLVVVNALPAAFLHLADANWTNQNASMAILSVYMSATSLILFLAVTLAKQSR